MKVRDLKKYFEGPVDICEHDLTSRYFGSFDKIPFSFLDRKVGYIHLGCCEVYREYFDSKVPSPYFIIVLK